MREDQESERAEQQHKNVQSDLLDAINTAIQKYLKTTQSEKTK
jgi:hypothetical protein